MVKPGLRALMARIVVTAMVNRVEPEKVDAHMDLVKKPSGQPGNLG
jgi:hypothetical protein